MKGKAIRYNDHHLYFKTLSHFSSSANIEKPLDNHQRLSKVDKRVLFVFHLFDVVQQEIKM